MRQAIRAKIDHYGADHDDHLEVRGALHGDVVGTRVRLDGRKVPVAVVRVEEGEVDALPSEVLLVVQVGAALDGRAGQVLHQWVQAHPIKD